MAFDGRVSLEWLRTDPATGREVTKELSAWYEHLRRLVTLTTIFESGAFTITPPLDYRLDA